PRVHEPRRARGDVRRVPPRLAAQLSARRTRRRVDRLGREIFVADETRREALRDERERGGERPCDRLVEHLLRLRRLLDLADLLAQLFAKPLSRAATQLVDPPAETRDER